MSGESEGTGERDKGGEDLGRTVEGVDGVEGVTVVAGEEEEVSEHFLVLTG